jgi:hypothetical protein
VKSLIFLNLIVFVALDLYAQKPSLTLDDLKSKNWARVNDPKISNDGKYAFYQISNLPGGASKSIVKECYGTWEVDLKNARSITFSNDSRKLYYISGEDSLCSLNLATKKLSFIAPAADVSISTNGREENLIYRTKLSKLVFWNTSKEKQVSSLPGVSEFSMFPDAGFLLIKIMDNNTGHDVFQLLNLKNHKRETIWSQPNSTPQNLTFDKSASQVAFSFERDNGGLTDNVIWLYKLNSNSPSMLVDNTSAGIDKGLRLGSMFSFSEDGNRIVFYLQPMKPDSAVNADVRMDLWSYTDSHLQSLQLFQLEELKQGRGFEDLGYAAVIGLNNKKITRLGNDNEKINIMSAPADSLALIERWVGDESEWNWSTLSEPSFFIINIITGKKKKKPQTIKIKYRVVGNIL